MELAKHLAKHIRDVHIGGNWTASNVKDQLSDVTLKEALEKVGTYNTIATLAFHMNYFVVVVKNVLEGNALDAHDKFSFDHPPFIHEDEWKSFVEKMISDATRLADLIEKLPEIIFWQDFTDPKYGNYYRNIQGIIEHTHYHLGQIVLLKKMVRNRFPE